MLTTDNPLTVVRVGSHNDPDQVKALQLEQEIKDVGVERPETAPGQIIDQKVNDLPYEVLAHLPKREALKRSVNRRRQAELPQNPQSLEDLLQILPEFQNTLAWEKILLYDSLDDDNQERDDPRILVFATRENLRKLAHSPTWFCYGTFKVCPSLFTRIFTIHGMNANVAFPFVYALLPNKTQASYGRVFEVVKQKSAE